MKNTHSMHIDDDVYQMLREAQGRQETKISLRQLLQRYVKIGIQRDKELGKWDRALQIHLRNSDNSESLLEYLNSDYALELIRLLDKTKPSYNDIAQLFGAMLFWGIDGKELFNTLLVYAKFGLSELKGE